MNRHAPLRDEAVPSLVAEVEQLRATLDRVRALCVSSHREPPPTGHLVVAEYAGGHQHLPRHERVFIRADLPAGSDEGTPYAGGDWYPVGGGDERRLTWGEVLWLDDPPCDRGTVSLDVYVPVEEIILTLDGQVPA